ncbi:MAG: triose-phosphate isomerase [Candidatus Staskawiczbacteria bacterium]|nr:triose-phosphate isomerase [Candidatus Staskawiczbacteria bacterium]
MKILVVANWKMNPASLEEAKNIFQSIKNGVEGTKAEVVVCPPFVYLPELKGLTLGAQDIFYEEKGAFTGEVSGDMLKNLGVEYVIIGHSERRKYLGETDEIINEKIKKALESGLKVIFCIGENNEQKEKAETEAVLKKQLMIALNGIPVPALENFTIAYEPVWAISSGDPYKTKELPTPESVKKTQDYIRSVLVNIFSEGSSENVRIIYGGSVNAGNVKDYLEDAKVQGFLVGGASLMPDDFIQIVKSAE